MKAVQLSRRDGLVIALASALTGSLCFNIARGFSVPRPGSGSSRVAVGTKIPSLSLLDSNGERQDVRLDDGRSSVLYVMSPSCVWCARNLKNMQALGAARAGQFRFLGVSVTSVGLQQYLRETPMPFPIRLVDAEHLPEGLDMSATPLTVVVGPDGRVKKAWSGALYGASLEEVDKFFGVKLPGAQMPAIKKASPQRSQG